MAEISGQNKEALVELLVMSAFCSRRLRKRGASKAELQIWRDLAHAERLGPMMPVVGDVVEQSWRFLWPHCLISILNPQS